MIGMVNPIVEASCQTEPISMLWSKTMPQHRPDGFTSIESNNLV